MTVVEVDGEDEFKEEVDEVVENFLVQLSRRWWRGFNRGCCRSLCCSTHSSRSGSLSCRAQACDTLACDVGVFGVSVYRVSWSFRQLRRVGCLSWVYGWLSVVRGAYRNRVIRRRMKATTTALVTIRVTSSIVWFMRDDEVVGLRCRREG